MMSNPLDWKDRSMGMGPRRLTRIAPWVTCRTTTTIPMVARRAREVAADGAQSGALAMPINARWHAVSREHSAKRQPQSRQERTVIATECLWGCKSRGIVRAHTHSYKA